MEIWKDIEGYNGDYQVSNLGRVKSFKKRFGKQACETIMSPSKTYFGYSRVVLFKDKKPKLFSVHRLVAEAFIPNTDNKPLVDHINGDREDNRVENLRWCTHSENSQNSILLKKRKRYNSVRVKDNYGNEFDSYRQAGRFWGLSPNTVKNDCKNKIREYQNFTRKVRFMEVKEWKKNYFYC